MDRIDLYEKRPPGMDKYLANYGWHFSQKMAEWAISMMRDKNDKKLECRDKASIEADLKSNGLELHNNKGYDLVYVYAMIKADRYGGSVTSAAQHLLAVQEYLDDKDGYEGIALTRFYADCIAKGEPVLWEAML